MRADLLCICLRAGEADGRRASRSSVLPSGETILFNSEVEETVMKRRTSRLKFPITVAPRKPKIRQLVLTSQRLVCLKQLKHGRGIGIKSEYALRPLGKGKEREKEERCMVTGIVKKGAKEFVMYTVSLPGFDDPLARVKGILFLFLQTSKSAFFVANSEESASEWVNRVEAIIRARDEQREQSSKPPSSPIPRT